MADTFYLNLGDQFTKDDGSMADYVGLGGSYSTSYQNRKHYDLRQFTNASFSGGNNMTDMSFWNVNQFQGKTMTQLSSQGQFVFGLGNENWDTSDGAVTFGPDASLRYLNVVTMTIGTGVTKTATSTFTENLMTLMADNTKTYTIQLVLPGFPAQAASPHADLTASFLDISSSASFVGGQTDSIPFSATTHSVSAGGDTYLSFPSTLIVNADKTAIAGVRLRVKSIGGTLTFKAAALRIIPNDYTFKEIDTNTKRKQLIRSVPQSGGTEPSTTYGTQLFSGPRPANITLGAKFNSGHNPVGNDNILNLYTRYAPNGDHVRVELKARSTQSTLSIIQNISSVDTILYTSPTLTNILGTTTDYYLSFDVYNAKATATLYTFANGYIGSQVYTTGAITVTKTNRGLVGYNFAPYNYDFTLNFVNPTRTEFVTFESTPFRSLTPVTGATIVTYDAAPASLLDSGSLLVAGDAALTEGSIGDPAPSLKLVRTGVGWYGGVKSPLTELGELSSAIISGQIYPVSQVRGTYRVALQNSDGSIVYLAEIPNLLPNKWNSFELFVPVNITPSSYYVLVNQAGFYADTFYVDNLKVESVRVTWEVSNDYGSTWYPFFRAKNTQWSGVKFLNPNTSLKVKAIAHSDINTWIQGYNLIPHYKFPGHI